jgi:hypothetical protein
MQIRAENDPRFWRKFLIMGILAVCFAGYCLVDGLVRYPQQREQGFADFKSELAKSQHKSMFSDSQHRDMDLAEFEAIAVPEQLQEWEHYSVDRGIPSAASVVMQFIMATISFVVGLLLLSFPLRARGRWIEGNDTGVTSSWGAGFHFDEVEVINKRKWKSKGICKVTYVANGRRSTFIVDDYKFDRYRTDAILYELEQRVDPGRIVNGPPEPPPEPDGPVAAVPR